MNKKTLIVFIGIVVSVLSARTQNNTTIPLSSDVKYGKLSNGMTYYILQNEEPKDRVSLYFVQNVGAILEEDSQNGLAHFLEHMAFNGLENFPGKNMLNYLEKNGITFGSEINAYTAQDETVYNISNIPTGNENLLDSTLLVLHDWSGGLLLEAEEIEAERGVIHEEWRTGRNARFRLLKQSQPLLYNYSKYAERDVIGSLDVIDNFEHEELRDYYKKWYRPDLQAVVVVGDINPEEIEIKVKNLFSKIPARDNVAERVYYPVEDTEEITYVLAKDKEANFVSMGWIFRNPICLTRNEDYLRAGWVQSMFNSMFNDRLSELTQKPDCPAVGMQVGNFEMCRTKAANYINVSPKQGKELDAFALFITEFKRVKRYGFTETELDRIKKEFLRSYDSYLKNKKKISNDKWAKTLQKHFLTAEPAPSVEWKVEFAREVIPGITLEEVNQAILKFSNINNSVFSLSGPDKGEIEYPTKENLLAIVDSIKEMKLEAYQDETGDAPLLLDELNEMEFVSESEIKNTSAKLYELENGAKVVVLPTDYSDDEIKFNAFSFGGTSLLEREVLESGEMATTLAMMSGVGDFNAIKLRKKLSEKLVRVQPYLSENMEGFSGSVSPDDLETMLTLIYQYFENPRFDKEAFQAQLDRMKNYLQNAKADNSKTLEDTIALMVTNHHKRTLIFNEEYIENIDFEKAKQIYQDRYKDASDFTFVFVGSINEDKHLPIIRKYIGNISTYDRKENWKDHNVRIPEGSSQNIFEIEMEVPKSTVYLQLSNKLEYSLKNRLYVHVISELLSKKYMEVIREKEGGTYGVSVRPSIQKRPYEHFTISISFDCAPENQERLRELVAKEINAITSTISEVDLEEIKKNFIKNREQAEKSNSYWLRLLKGSLTNNETITDLDAYNEVINDIDVQKVKGIAKKLFRKYDMVEVVMNPKTN